MTGFRLPNFHQRLWVGGRTGSGKTQFSAWALSLAPFDRQPYVIIDYKHDELLNSIDRIKEIGLDEIPKHPGLYIIHPRPDESDELENWLWKVWARERIGLYVDEAATPGSPFVARQGAFVACLSQGRSKRLPVIACTQRPAWVSASVFSEADFFACFHLNHDRDELRVKEFTPRDSVWNFKQRLPNYNCRWYDVADDFSAIIRPAPDRETILQTFDKRLTPKRRLI